MCSRGKLARGLSENGCLSVCQRQLGSADLIPKYLVEL